MDVKLILDGDIVVVSLSGRIDIEKNQLFKRALLQNFLNKKVIFCMKNISFVGSSGIKSFFKVLDDLNADNKIYAKLAGLNPDFQRLFSVSNFKNVEMHESIEGAIQSF